MRRWNYQFLPDSVVGTSYIAHLSVATGTGPLTYSVNGTMPDGFTFNPTVLTISGMPTAAA
jgi:hypothetical protein